MKQLLTLGIESTAHTFGAAVLKGKNILSNEKDAFTTEDGNGGMVPVQVSEHHVKVCDAVIQKALQTAGVTIDDMQLISYSASPGMGHTLRIGAMAARSLAAVNDIPVIGVNHCIAHLEIGRMLTKAKDPVFLYASGANTQIIAYESGKYRVFGETLDMGIGNFLDQFARHIGFGFPGGPKIYEAAKGSSHYVKLPYVVKGMDVSFGGMLTNLKQKLKKGDSKEDLCYSLQETAFAMLVEVSERAMAHAGKKELLLGGGVACNKRLQEMCTIMCKERGAKMFVPENQYLVDNAAMIAWLGLVQYDAGRRQQVEESHIQPYLRTDDIDVVWRDD
ncbi:MAG: bifunctional N(6)-L-threonylcarbamoyladenine synthase/serine/threonine protein kinase [Nanoarchaeota archaeon]